MELWKELCPACETGRPSAGALIRQPLDPDRDPKALPKLFGTGRPRPCTPMAGPAPHSQQWGRLAHRIARPPAVEWRHPNDAIVTTDSQENAREKEAYVTSEVRRREADRTEALQRLALPPHSG